MAGRTASLRRVERTYGNCIDECSRLAEKTAVAGEGINGLVEDTDRMGESASDKDRGWASRVKGWPRRTGK